MPAPKWVEGRDDLQQDVGFSLTLSHTKSTTPVWGLGAVGFEGWRCLGAGKVKGGSGLRPPEEICRVVCAGEPHVDTDTRGWGKRSDGFLAALNGLWKSFSLQGAVVVEALWKLWASAATAVLCTKLSSSP